MSQQIPALPPPARADGPSGRPFKDGDAPPGGFAEVLGAAETATSPPTPGTRPARTAHAEGTKAEGDSSGPKHPASRKRAATDAADELAAAAGVDATLTAAPAPNVRAAGKVRHIATATEETGGPIRSASAHATPGAASRRRVPATDQAPGQLPVKAPAAAGQVAAAGIRPQSRVTPAAAAATLKPQSDDEAMRPIRDGRITQPAPPTIRSGGRRVRPTHPRHRLDGIPVRALKDDAGRPLRDVASRTTALGSALRHQTAPSATPAAATTIAPAATSAPAHRTASDTPRAAARPPQVRVHELAESMHAIVKVANRRGTAAARITLRPAELGGVQVQLRSHAGGVSASLTAETRAGAEALGVSYGELRRSLEAQGIVVHTIDVQFAGNGLGPDGRGERWQSLAQQMAGAVQNDDDDQDETTIEPSQLPDSGAQIDVLA
jgi:flagellar hook-length control protein FliK